MRFEGIGYGDHDRALLNSVHSAISGGGATSKLLYDYEPSVQVEMTSDLELNEYYIERYLGLSLQARLWRSTSHS